MRVLIELTDHNRERLCEVLIKRPEDLQSLTPLMVFLLVSIGYFHYEIIGKNALTNATELRMKVFESEHPALD